MRLLFPLMALLCAVIFSIWFAVDDASQDADGESLAGDSKPASNTAVAESRPEAGVTMAAEPEEEIPARDAGEESQAGSSSAWMHDMLQEAHDGNSEAIVRVIFGIANENSPLHEFLRTRTSIEEMTGILQTRIAQGDKDALLNAAGLLFSQADMEGLHLPGIYAMDIEYALQEAVRNGDAEATMMLGLLKLQDFSKTGDERSRDEALAMYRRLGEAGNPEALTALAYLHAGEDRFGVKRDPVEQRRWLEKFIEVADAGQASSLASSMLRTTRQPDPDPLEFEMGIRLLAKAGREGNEHALNEAAWILASCNGPEPTQFRHAETYIREHIERYGADAESMSTLAAVHARQGNFSAAITAQLEAIRLLEAQAIIPESPTYQAFYARLNQYQNGQQASEEEYCPE